MRCRPTIAFACLLGLPLLAALAIGPGRLLGSAPAGGPNVSVAGQAPDPAAIRFRVLHLVIDSPGPLAAWQVTLEPSAAVAAPAVRIVGVEGGSDAPFDEPPFFDPAAMRGDHLITGAFSLLPAEELPSGRVHVATIHLELRGDGDPAAAFDAALVAAADAAGRRLDARLIPHSGTRP